MNAAAYLRERAESFSRDAMVLRGDGDAPGDRDAAVLESIRDELRRCADAIEGDAVRNVWGGR